MSTGQGGTRDQQHWVSHQTNKSSLIGRKERTDGFPYNEGKQLMENTAVHFRLFLIEIKQRKRETLSCLSQTEPDMSLVGCDILVFVTQIV